MTITQLFTEVFFDTATHLTELLVPIIVIYILFDLIGSLLWGGRDR